MKIALLGVLALQGVALASVRTASPVERVVNLMRDMRKSIIKQGETEQNMYDKFRCWTVNTGKKKTDAITKAQLDMRSFFQEMQVQMGLVKVLSNEIADLDGKINSEQASLDEMLAERTAKHMKYEEETDTAKATIKALHEAILALTNGQKQGASLVQVSEAKHAVKSALMAMPSTRSIKAHELVLLHSFSQSGNAAAYAPQSQTILGILKSQMETAARTVQSLNENEGAQSTSFEEFQYTKEKSIQTCTKSRDEKAAQKADAEAALAAAQTNFADTDAQRKADIEFWNTITKNGLAKKAEWEQREEMRQQELKGIGEALDIMTSDEARELFGKSIQPGMQSFLQTEASQKTAAQKAYAFLRAQATKNQDVGLALLAVRVRQTTGPFAEVIQVLDKQIQNLHDEGLKDTHDRDKCKEDLSNITRNKAEYTAKIEHNNEMITRHNKLKDMRHQEKDEAQQAEADERQSQAEMTEEREAAHAEYQQAKADDQGALELMNRALDKVSKFYKENGFLQKGKEPQFAVSADQAPDATFSSKGSHSQEAGGIIGLMTMIIEDLEGEIRAGDNGEVEAQTEYMDALAKSKRLIKELERKQDDLAEEISALEGKINRQDKKKTDNKKEFMYYDEWEKQIRPDCDWLNENFEARHLKREGEITGVESAKHTLEGAASS